MVFVGSAEDMEIGKIIVEDLRRCGLPCALLDEPSEKSLINVCLDANACSIMDQEKLLFADKSALKDPLKCHAELERIRSRVADVLFIKYGFTAGAINIGPVSMTSKGVKYFGKPVYFTDTEKLIVVLLAINKNEWLRAEDIVNHCLGEGSALSAASVHINSINKKTSMCSPLKLINTRRYRGYKINIK